MDNLQKRIIEVFRRPSAFDIPSIICAVATVSKEGKPKVRYVQAAIGDDFKIRFAAFNNSRKISEIKQNPNVSLSCGHMYPKIEVYLQIDAQAKVTDSLIEKEKMWYKPLQHVFTGTNDPNYVVVILEPSRIEVFGPSMKNPEVWQK